MEKSQLKSREVERELARLSRDLEDVRKDLERSEADRVELKKEARAATEKLSEAQASLDCERRSVSRQGGQVGHQQDLDSSVCVSRGK